MFFGVGCGVWSHGTAAVSIPTIQHNTTQHSTAQHSTAQRSTAQHSAAQHSTAQHSTAQHSTRTPHHNNTTTAPTHRVSLQRLLRELPATVTARKQCHSHGLRLHSHCGGRRRHSSSQHIVGNGTRGARTTLLTGARRGSDHRRCDAGGA